MSDTSFRPAKERAFTVLLVEDEALIRMSLADFLEDRGFEVIETATAAEAIEVLRTSIERIDLVFSDVRMPGEMDGFGLAAWLQVNHQGLPVILTSGDIGQANVARKVFSGER